MKSKQIATLILMAGLLCSCQKKEKTPVAGQPETVGPQKEAAQVVHRAVVQEVVQATNYTYLRLKEKGVENWAAIKKAQIEPGETITYGRSLEMRNFKSRDLQKTFEKIYFIGAYKKEGDPVPSPAAGEKKTVTIQEEVSVVPAVGGITIGELYANKDKYAGKIVAIRGQVTKFNAMIIRRNWVHLQDGTSGEGKHDLVITTLEHVAVGDVLTFEGKISLNKDFGAGYKYDVIMEDAKKKK